VKWRDTTLGDVVTLKRGHDLPESARQEGEVPIVSSSGITGHHNEPKANAPGVVTGRYGTIGEVYYLDHDYWPLNTSLYVTDFKGNHPRFVAYFLRNALQNYQSDKAAVPGVNRNVLHQLMVRVPTPCEQQRIADILSAYDDAIENNRRRITLLEDAARHLYEEWFVRLRFPGHEHVRIKDGVPDGWAIRKLVDLCEEKSGIQTGPFGSQLHQSDYTDQGVPVVMPRDLATLRISEAEIARIPEDLADRLSRHQMQTGDIVYGRRGDIGRRALVLGRQRGYVCGTGCLRLRPRKSRIDPTFLFHALGSPETQGAIRNRAHGATMPNLSAKLMASIPVHIPARQLRTLFAEYAGGIAEIVDILNRQIAKLGVARDFLLPRLMSGEIAA